MSCVNERRVVGSGGGGGGSEMGYFGFSRRMEHLDRRHLSVPRSASGGFKGCTQLLSLPQKSMEC